jgi:hypothetical protein
MSSSYGATVMSVFGLAVNSVGKSIPQGAATTL